MKNIIKIILLIIIIANTNANAQRIVQNLNNDWKFSYGWQAYQNNTKNENINIPHTWNLDALAGKTNYYRGMGNYLKEFKIPKQWEGKQKIYLHFSGVNSTTEIYLNGRRVGEHKGGYTAFGFDITPFVSYSNDNILWVRVSNATNLNVMPLVGNFNFYGGIYRDVKLIVTPNTHISHTKYATSGIKIEQQNVSTQNATVTINTELESWDRKSATLEMTVLDAQGSVIAKNKREVRFGNSNQTEIKWTLEIENPKLWDGVENPHLYRARVVVRTDNTPFKDIADTIKIAKIDSLEQTFGLRFFEVTANNEFMLNGKPLQIRGVTRIADNATLGGALYRQNMRRDIEIIQDMGANAIRLSYFPSDKYFLELCDNAGIIVWSDLPFIGPGEYRETGFNDSEDFRQNGLDQLSEMIAQQYNHPSVMFWGLFNEITQRGSDPLPYLQALNQIAKQEDPMRLTTASSNQDGELNFVTDLIGFNLYMGWKQGMPQDLEQWGDGVRKDWPRLKVALSEYGAGGSEYQWERDLKKPILKSYWHPEVWQTHVHQECYKIISQKKYFWGTFASSMFDWGVASKREGIRPGVSDLGLVTFDRATKKDAFYFYKANWNNKDLFVYITTRRHKQRVIQNQEFTIFSNCSQVTLSLNDSVVGVLDNDGFGTFCFKDLELEEGSNTIEVFSSSGQRDKITVYFNPRGGY